MSTMGLKFLFQFIRTICRILIGACTECELARADQAAKAGSADLLHHPGVARYYRRQIAEITDLETSLQNVLTQIQTNLADAASARNRNRIYTDISVLLGYFEQANLVGFNARPFLVRRIINATRLICEGTASPSGHFLVWFRQVYNLLDTLFQTRVALSMFYHTVR